MPSTHSVVVYILMTLSPNGQLTQHRFPDYTSCNQEKMAEVRLAREAGVELTAKCVPQQLQREGHYYDDPLRYSPSHRTHHPASATTSED